MRKIMSHQLYMDKCKTMTTDQLKYAITDAQEALAAMPEGVNAGFYADEINYCGMELQFRKQKAMYTSRGD